MKKKLKKIIPLMLALSLVLGMMPAAALADDSTEVTASGTCGDNLTWELTSDGTLTISGTGEMDNYTYSSKASIPWYSCRGEIYYLIIEDGVTSIGDFAFYHCSSLMSITIPDSVTSIGGRAFYYCSGLTGVTIPDSVTSMGDYTFALCSSLTSITIPDSVTSIVPGAFWYCSSLTSITIPDSVTSIGDRAFSYCSSLTDVYYSGSEDDWNAITIGATGNEYLTSATIHYSSTGSHDWGEPEWTWYNGSATAVFTCSSCGETYEITTDEIAVSYDCDSSSIYYTASVTGPDGEEYSDTLEVWGINLEHIWGEPEWVWADDYSGADAVFTCTLCGKECVVSKTGGVTQVYDGKQIAYTISVTGPDGETYTNTVYIEREYFVLPDDTNSFSHSSTYFVSGYETGYFNLLLDMNTGHSSAYAELQQKKTAEWNGSCQGMALSMIYTSEGKLTGIFGDTDYYYLGSPLNNTDLLNVINYYQLAQYSYNFEYTAQTFLSTKNGAALTNAVLPNYYLLSNFLEKFVEEAQKSEETEYPFMLSYTHYEYDEYGNLKLDKDGNVEESGHNVVVCGYETDSDGNHLIKIFDSNEQDEYMYMTVAADYSWFTFTDGNGVEVHNDGTILRYISISDLANAQWDLLTDDSVSLSAVAATAEVSESTDDIITVSFGTHADFVLTAADGGVLSCTDSSLSGDLAIYSYDVKGEETLKNYITTQASESFVISDIEGALEISVEISGTYYTCAVSGADTVVISGENGIEINGEAYSFTGGISVDMENADLICISGTAEGSSCIYISEGEIVLESENDCSDITAEIYNYTDYESETIEQEAQLIKIYDGDEEIVIEVIEEETGSEEETEPETEEETEPESESETEEETKESSGNDDSDDDSGNSDTEEDGSNSDSSDDTLTEPPVDPLNPDTDDDETEDDKDEEENTPAPLDPDEETEEEAEPETEEETEPETEEETEPESESETEEETEESSDGDDSDDDSGSGDTEEDNSSGSEDDGSLIEPPLDLEDSEGDDSSDDETTPAPLDPDDSTGNTDTDDDSSGNGGSGDADTGSGENSGTDSEGTSGEDANDQAADDDSDSGDDQESAGDAADDAESGTETDGQNTSSDEKETAAGTAAGSDTDSEASTEDTSTGSETSAEDTSASSESAATGDSNSLLFWLAVGALALALLVSAAARRKFNK